LSEHLGKQFYVENIGGAGGNVGMGQGAKAAPDGYTIIAVSPNIVINPTLYNKVPYDPYKDFDPVTIAVTTPYVLTVNPSLPVQTVRDLVVFIKSNPGKYNFASPGPGTGTPAHLVGEQLRLSLGLDLVHIPFTSGPFAPARDTDLVARLTGQWLSERLGQPFIIENRPGAGTNIGTEAVVRAPADGYTLLLASPPSAINATLYAKLNFVFSATSRRLRG
jgi:tripartite-type tricarboxylate transporter receptor subunit TctC